MQINARLRYLRMSPRKVRLVIDTIRGLSIEKAIHQLQFSPKNAAEPILKLLKSAMANAEHNYRADLATLRVVKITADQGPTLSRWRARAYGRAAPIRKRTSHIEIVLSDENISDVHASQVVGKRTSTKPNAVQKSEKTSKSERAAKVKKTVNSSEEGETKKPVTSKKKVTSNTTK